MSTELKHTKEPWAVSTGLGHLLNASGEAFFNHVDGNAEREALDAERAAACVNACSGIADPAAALQKAREALQAVSSTLDSRNNYLPKKTRLEVREALRLLTPEK